MNNTKNKFMDTASTDFYFAKTMGTFSAKAERGRSPKTEIVKSFNNTMTSGFGSGYRNMYGFGSDNDLSSTQGQGKKESE